MRTLGQSSVRAAMVERMRLLNENDQAVWGVMTPGQMLCHVRGAFRAAMGELAVARMRMGVPPGVIKAAALWSPVPWRRNFVTVPELRTGAPAMQPGRFADDLAATEEELLRFSRPGQARVDHPMMGAMAERDWLRWGYLHTDHHLRQFDR